MSEEATPITEAIDDAAAQALAASIPKRKTFRDFWGQCVRASRILRRTRDHEDVTLPRSAFRESLKDAWEAGADSRPPEPPAPSK